MPIGRNDLDLVWIRCEWSLAQLFEVLQTLQVVKVVYVGYANSAETNKWYYSFVLQCMYTEYGTTRFLLLALMHIRFQIRVSQYRHSLREWTYKLVGQGKFTDKFLPKNGNEMNWDLELSALQLHTTKWVYCKLLTTTPLGWEREWNEIHFEQEYHLFGKNAVYMKTTMWVNRVRKCISRTKSEYMNPCMPCLHGTISIISTYFSACRTIRARESQMMQGLVPSFNLEK